MPNLLLEEMTWPEIRDALEAGSQSVLLPVASVEQHGPALPLNTDVVIGRALAVRTAQELGDALVGPVLVPGCSDHHMSWPGTITLPASLLVAVVTECVRSLARHGFREIVVLPTHGGNFSPLASGMPEIRRAAAGARVIDLADSKAFFGAWFRVLHKFGRRDETLPHADVMETSLMLYLRPELVRSEYLAPGYTGQLDLEELTRKGLAAFTKNGVLGDPRGASPELGRALLEEVSRYLAEEIRKRRAPRTGKLT